VNREPLSNSALPCILSQYVKKCPVRVSNRGGQSCCYGYSLNTLHIPNKTPPPLKTFWILQLYIPTCASVPSMADIAECVVYFPLFHPLWCSRRLWWTVYDSRACCCLVSSFIQRGAVMIEVTVSMCLHHCPLLNKVADFMGSGTKVWHCTHVAMTTVLLHMSAVGKVLLRIPWVSSVIVIAQVLSAHISFIHLLLTLYNCAVESVIK
jgi:hypothetical protein